jgi:hypothetical protein
LTVAVQPVVQPVIGRFDPSNSSARTRCEPKPRHG